jgi:hypothetical protein
LISQYKNNKFVNSEISTFTSTLEDALVSLLQK